MASLYDPTETITELPNSPESEEALLGSILMNPDILIEIKNIIPSSDCFFTLRNAWIYDAMLAIEEDSMISKASGEKEIAIDNITLGEKLKSRNQLIDIGGMAYITKLMLNVVSYQ